MTFARRVFRFAGIYGLIVLLPQYFLEARIGHDVRPPITHPEFFYGFLGVAAAWQVAFLIVTQARCGTGRSCWPEWSRSFHLRSWSGAVPLRASVWASDGICHD